MTKCNRNGCPNEGNNDVETWVASVPIHYNVCNEHKIELEKEK